MFRRLKRCDKTNTAGGGGGRGNEEVGDGRGPEREGEEQVKIAPSSVVLGTLPPTGGCADFAVHGDGFLCVVRDASLRRCCEVKLNDYEKICSARDRYISNSFRKVLERLMNYFACRSSGRIRENTKS